MISISGKKWIETKVNKNSIEKIKQDLNYSNIVSRLIVSRNFDDQEINNIKNDLSVTNIFRNKDDFILSEKILINSIKKREKICILGDYDVDGTASTSLFVKYFKHINQPYFYYIPDRIKDGYGPSIKLFKQLVLQKPKLVIMVDCGSNARESIEYLNQNNIKSIIIDHHEINKPYPKSNSIINPKKNNGYIKYDYFCATTLSYFFLDMVIKNNKSNFVLDNFLIYVLLATICDVMPMRKVNRLIALNVMRNLYKKKNIIIDTIFHQIGLKKRLMINDFGYLIGPIINSGGRLGYSNYGTELLTLEELSLIKKKSFQLIKLNNQRKIIEDNILNEIDFDKIKKENKKVIIYCKKNINEGLIGIIASRLKDRFNKPSIVITNSNNIFKGSARSTDDYNIGNLMKKLIDENIIISGGGHNMAAGFSIFEKKIQFFDEFIQNDFSKKNLDNKNLYYYDLEIAPSAINNNFMKEINKIGPFGNKNLPPYFLIKNLKIIRSNILNNKHISLIIKSNNGRSFKSICFNSINTEIGNYLLSYKKKINIIGEITENIWNNKKTIQLDIKDLILAVN